MLAWARARSRSCGRVAWANWLARGPRSPTRARCCLPRAPGKPYRPAAKARSGCRPGAGKIPTEAVGGRMPPRCRCKTERTATRYLPISSRPVISSISIMVVALSCSSVDGVNESDPKQQHFAQVVHQPRHFLSPLARDAPYDASVVHSTRSRPQHEHPSITGSGPSVRRTVQQAARRHNRTRDVTPLPSAVNAFLG